MAIFINFLYNFFHLKLYLILAFKTFLVLLINNNNCSGAPAPIHFYCMEVSSMNMLQSISFVFQERTSYRFRITLGWLNKRTEFSFLSDLFNIFVYPSTTNNSSTVGSLDVQYKYPQIDRLKWWQVRHNGGKIEDRRMREDESLLEKREARARKKNYLPFIFFITFSRLLKNLLGLPSLQEGKEELTALIVNSERVRRDDALTHAICAGVQVSGTEIPSSPVPQTNGDGWSSVEVIYVHHVSQTDAKLWRLTLPPACGCLGVM